MEKITHASAVVNPQFQVATLPELLERAGFRIRGRRADCVHCEGHSRMTVSFTDEVAYCHRCAWTGNARTLSRELALPIAPETREQRERRDQAVRFAAWTHTCEILLLRRLRRLTERAALAREALADFPDLESAWCALADYYHNEASLMGALDFLTFEKLSSWLEEPMTRETLAAAFNEACTRPGVADAN